MTVVAAFDVDGTLTTRDSVVPYMRRVRGTFGLATRVVARPVQLVGAVARRDRDAVKAVATAAAFTGLRHDHLSSEGRSFARMVAAERLRADTMARLGWHRGQGHEIVLVSASFEIYLEHLAPLVGAVAALGTRLVVDPDGRCTGSIEGQNCRGPEKVRRLGEWLDRHHGGRSAVELWAYGDSPGDRELLADADRPFWVEEPLVNVVPDTSGGPR